jgi:excisionase family DNA binding protein
MAQADKTMLTTAEAARYLGTTPRTLGDNWFKWKLTAYRVGRRNVYRVADLDRYLADNKITQPRRVA